MNGAHTPGPWIVTEQFNSHVIRGANIERQSDGISYNWRDYVASIWGGYNKLDADLIAAAPCLLAALQRALNVLDATGAADEAAAARAAIAKAQGGAS